MSSRHRLFAIAILAISQAGWVNPPIQESDQNFAFAYFYGKESTLMITPISDFPIYSDASVSYKAQTYRLTRDNNIKFKNYLRAKYPGQAVGLTEEVQTIMVDQDLAGLSEQREFMIQRSENSVIQITDFVFASPELSTPGQIKPQ